MAFLSKSVGFFPSLNTLITKLPYRVNTIKRSFSNDLPVDLKRGDIVLFKGKFEGEMGDVVQSKNRPHIVISSEKVMQVTNRIVMAPLSTATARFKYEVVIPNTNRTGINEPSKVMANQIRTVFSDERFVKIGTAFDLLDKVDQALEICFGNFTVKKKLEISRGDVVQIDFGNFVRSGIIVSNDIGNHASQIAMLAHAHKTNEVMNEFDLIVKAINNNRQTELLVQCYMINTFDQGIMDKKGHISEADMHRITNTLFKTLGIEK